VQVTEHEAPYTIDRLGLDLGELETWIPYQQLEQASLSTALAKYRAYATWFKVPQTHLDKPREHSASASADLSQNRLNPIEPTSFSSDQVISGCAERSINSLLGCTSDQPDCTGPSFTDDVNTCRQLQCSRRFSFVSADGVFRAASGTVRAIQQIEEDC
jgi:hypothetical protein